MADAIVVLDEVTPWLKEITENNPVWCNRALKSTGWMVQKEIKQGIRSRAPGGSQYAKGMSAAKRRLLDAGRGRRTFRTYKPLGQLVKAIGYDKTGLKSDGSGSVRVGWLSDSAIYLGSIQEEGKTITITPKMRRYFWALGLKLKQTTTEIKIPARQTIEPMRKKLEPAIPEYFEQKMYEYWMGNTSRSSPKNNRKYRVKSGGFDWAEVMK